MSVSTWSGSLLTCERELSAWKARLDSVFGLQEWWETDEAFVDELLSGIEREKRVVSPDVV